MGARMADTDGRPLPRWFAAVLVVVAAATATALLSLPGGERDTTIAWQAAVVGAALLSAIVLWAAARRPGGWPGADWLGTALLVLAAGAAVALVQELREEPARGPSPLDLLYLLALVPLVA